MTICCSIRGTAVEALHDHTAEACIMSEFLMDTFLGSMSLVPIDKLFRSPSGLFFECRGIARVVSVTIDKIEVKLDIHIYPIVDFELLTGCPLETHLQEKSLQGSLNHDSGKTSFATPISCPEIPMAKHHLDHNSQEEVMFVSPFVPPNIASPPDPLNGAFLKRDMSEEWSNGKGHVSEAVRINSPSTIIPCSIRGILVEAQLIPNMEGDIMPWHLARTLLGSVSLKPFGKLLESCPFGHILECRGGSQVLCQLL